MGLVVFVWDSREFPEFWRLVAQFGSYPVDPDWNFQGLVEKDPIRLDHWHVNLDEVVALQATV